MRDLFECPECGLQFSLTGDPLACTLRLEPGQNPKRCQTIAESGLAISCPNIQERRDAIICRRAADVIG